jgi:hypothetical protein
MIQVTCSVLGPATIVVALTTRRLYKIAHFCEKIAYIAEVDDGRYIPVRFSTPEIFPAQGLVLASLLIISTRSVGW